MFKDNPDHWKWDIVFLLLQDNKFYINNKSDDIVSFMKKLINFYSPNNNAGFKKRKAAKHDSLIDNNRLKVLFYDHGLFYMNIYNSTFQRVINFSIY